MLSNVHVIRDKTMHHSPANDVHDNSQEEVENYCIAKYFYVPLIDKKYYLEFLDLIDLKPQ